MTRQSDGTLLASLAQPEAAMSPIKTIDDVPDWVPKYHRLILADGGRHLVRYSSDLLFSVRMSEEEALRVRHIVIEDGRNRRRVDIDIEPLSSHRELEENGLLHLCRYRGTDIAFSSQGSYFFRWPEGCRYEILYPVSHMADLEPGHSMLRLTLNDEQGAIVSRRYMDVVIPSPFDWREKAFFTDAEAWIDGDCIAARGVHDGLDIPRNLSIHWRDAAGRHVLNRDRILRSGDEPLLARLSGSLDSASVTIDDDRHWSATIVVLKGDAGV